jgi:phosphoesterase RecJ-like protein
VSLDELKAGKLGNFDLILIVDTNSKSQLSGLADYLQTTTTPVLVIDHHDSTDSLGTVEVREPSAAAAGLLVFDLLKQAGWSITPKIAECLFVAVAADTGWFRFNNTDGRTLSTCAELAELGADPSDIHHQVYQTWSLARFKLMLAMLNSLELHLDGRVAVQYLKKEDFEATGAAYKDTENLIDECQRISTVEVAVLLIEAPEGDEIRCSLRSRNGVDVCKIAQGHGGGGHKSAAGVHLPGPIENAKQTILSLITQQMTT